VFAFVRLQQNRSAKAETLRLRHRKHASREVPIPKQRMERWHIRYAYPPMSHHVNPLVAWYRHKPLTNRSHSPDNKVVFCTGGAGSICSAQVRALVHLGANACIIGRNVSKTENMAKDIATARPGAKVLGLGAVDVRKPEALVEAAERCVKELGSIDFVMWVLLSLFGI